MRCSLRLFVGVKFLFSQFTERKICFGDWVFVSHLGHLYKTVNVLFWSQVAITPEVTSRGVNRAVMEQLVKLHRESALGQRLPVYDGRKSLYTAGPLPFQLKEFQISLLEQDDGSTTPR
jgi:hypothetical protein